MPSALKLLIIDDEKDICEVLQAKFEDAGYDCFIAYDGVSGFDKVVAHQPSCVVLDIRMPKEDGLSFLRKLRAYRHEDAALESRIRKTPVIVLTAAGSNMRSLFQMEGISEYFDKPFDFDVLQQRVAKLSGSLHS